MPVQSSSSSSASSTSSAGPPTPPIEPPSALITSLTAFARQLSEKEHLLATSSGDDELARQALEVTKSIFDAGESGLSLHLSTWRTTIDIDISIDNHSTSIRPLRSHPFRPLTRTRLPDAHSNPHHPASRPFLTTQHLPRYPTDDPSILFPSIPRAERRSTLPPHPARGTLHARSG